MLTEARSQATNPGLDLSSALALDTSSTFPTLDTLSDFCESLITFRAQNNSGAGQVAAVALTADAGSAHVDEGGAGRVEMGTTRSMKGARLGR